MKEEFKVIPDFPAYRVSNYGRIQSRWKRGAFFSGFQIKDKWKDLPTRPDAGGYLQIHLCDGYGKIKTARLHNLVAELFLGKKQVDKIVIRHLDSNPSNNTVDNLAYGTYAENENDKIENGTWNTRNGGAKITPLQVSEIRERLSNRESHNSLALEFGVSRPTISRIANNKTWRWL